MINVQCGQLLLTSFPNNGKAVEKDEKKKKEICLERILGFAHWREKGTRYINELEGEWKGDRENGGKGVSPSMGRGVCFEWERRIAQSTNRFRLNFPYLGCSAADTQSASSEDEWCRCVTLRCSPNH